jgi:SAM-dependent methyltransferase
MSSSERFYDDLSQNYASVLENRANYLVSVEKIVSSKLSRSKKEKLLDIGSGDGMRIKRIVLGADIEITAIENSAEMCNLLRTNSAIARVYETDIVKLDVQSSTYNYVTALWNVFGHVEEIEIAIKHAYESLVAGGTFIFDVNNPLNIGEYGVYSVTKNFLSFVFGANERRFKLIKGTGETWVYFRSNWHYRKILQSAGFKDLSFLHLNYQTGNRTISCNGQTLIFCVK